ncbi:hypothetical protein SOVF_021970 [Spinacia oleracea]|nr:hypothetical protein SOVF_021970 [Spinacia oleracea]
MSSCFFLIHFFFITLIVFLVVPLSSGENTKYTDCSIPFSCGKIKNIGYPFWGGNRSRYCGFPDFQLYCQESADYPTMSLFQFQEIDLSVVGINTSSHVMLFSLEILSERCYLLPTGNLTLVPSLKPEASNINISYGCTNCSSRNHYKSFNCSYFDGTYGTAYYLGNQSDIIRRTGNSCSCKNTVPFPVDKKGLDELKSTNHSLLSILTNWPIKTEYMANFPACSKCEESGGRCGSLDEQFVCHCQNGSHPRLCQDTEKKKSELFLGLGIGAFGGALLVFVAITVFWHRKKLKFVLSRSASHDLLEEGSIYFSVPRFSYSELVEATANFDRSKELGNGGYGIVYYGKLKDGREVAVKCLYEKSYKRLEQFMNEIQILTRLRHQNLVSLYGCTSQHCKELLLVYEYVKNGTVADHLYGKNTTSRLLLPWPIRLRIAIETATALSYLHASDIIHRDVKTNNILLDNNFSVKVADFGLSRLFPTDKTHVSTAPQGTPGYLDPEYHQCYRLTDKSDVYSFGVVLIELISSLPAIDMDRDKHEVNLFNYAMNRIQRCAFDELVDPQLGFALDFKVKRMTTLVAELAFQCLQHDKEFRPSMDEVLGVLNSIEGADYEALQAEEMAKNVKVEDYEALIAEEMTEIAAVEDYEGFSAEETAKDVSVEVVKMHTANSLSAPVEDDQAQLLNNHRSNTSSPISVMNKWVSSSTT